MKSIAFLLLLVTAALAAPPSNDNFVNRINLGSGALITATGTNVDATLEVDENDLDLLGGRSVWWKWTAPANAFVSVDTNSSAIDTVLAVYADGPTLQDAFVVGFNDESGEVGSPAGASRVVFSATAATEYHIAVHGLFGEQGNVALRVQSGVTPPIQITSLSLAPSSVDVTSASQTITADLGVSSSASFARGSIIVYRAGFVGSSDVPFTSANLLSGTPTNGVYRVSLPISRYSPPGTWFLEVEITDSLSRTVVHGRGVSALFAYDHVLSSSLPVLFSVSNTGAQDSTGPILQSFSRSPSAVNVAASAASLTFTFRVTDDLSGFSSGTLTLYTPNGDALVALPFGAAQRISGHQLDGTYSFSFNLPPKMPSGVWSIALLLRDAVGNPGNYEPSAPPLGSSSDFSVTGAPNSYWSWLYPLVSGTPRTLPSDDYDGDGVSNLLEFAFGMSPEVNDSSDPEVRAGLNSGLPSPSLTGNALTLTYVRRKAFVSAGLGYLPQFSPSLLSNSWTTGAGGVVSPDPGDFERVTITDPFPSDPRRFGRVLVNLAE